MPSEAAVAAAPQSGGSVAPAAAQKSFPFVLKKIMDIPPPNILEEGEDGKTDGRRRVRTCRPTCGLKLEQQQTEALTPRIVFESRGTFLLSLKTSAAQH